MADKPQKNYQRSNYSVFEEGMKALGLTGPQLGEAIGYSRTAWNRWSEDKEIPKAAAMAIECLRRRGAPNAKDMKEHILVVRCTTEHEKLAIVGVARAMDLDVKEV